LPWVYLVLRSRYGLALFAIRDSEATAESAGVDSFRTKPGVYVLIIGGVGTIEGPIIGVIVFYALQRYLADFGTWYLILLGALAIVTMLFAPQGIWGCVAQRYRTALFAVRRMLVRSYE